MNAAQRLLDRIYTDHSFAELISTSLFPTSVSKIQGEYITGIVKRKKPETVLELGLGFGISSLWIQSGMFRPVRHVIIDPNRKATRNNVVYQLLKKRRGVRIVATTSQVYLAAFEVSGKQADMVLIDADERFDAVMTDMYFVTNILKVGGIVVVRNIWNPGVRKAVMFYLTNLPYEVVGVSTLQQQVIKNIPIAGELLLRMVMKPTDLCVMQLAGKDSRPWRHFRGF